mmetsp:Transcript_21891/g.69884  ORF Transcript_21891/g.69884 Transcript_21891/m.69884 type:complete len:84 (+) Transcript_21891:71-322(+)
MRAIDALQLAKLDACASLLWSLANGELIDAKLSAYFGPRYEETQWAAPVALGTRSPLQPPIFPNLPPISLRSPVGSSSALGPR